jgi:hypothetical protein
VFDLSLLLLLSAVFAGALGYVWACLDLTRKTGTDEGKTR